MRRIAGKGTKRTAQQTMCRMEEAVPRTPQGTLEYLARKTGNKQQAPVIALLTSGPQSHHGAIICKSIGTQAFEQPKTIFITLQSIFYNEPESIIIVLSYSKRLRNAQFTVEAGGPDVGHCDSRSAPHWTGSSPLSRRTLHTWQQWGCRHR